MLCRNDNAIKLLYIEDNDALRTMAAEIFKRFGYQVKCANSGQQGIEKAKSWQPDCILTDFCMPVMSGDRVISTLRAIPVTSKVPIFVLSASINAKAASLQAGANGFFSKPANLYDVDQAIRETLNCFSEGGR